MEFKELKKKSVSDLHKVLAESREKLRDLRFKDASKQLKDVRQIRKIRATIAQVMTLLNKKDDSEKELKQVSKEQKSDIQKNRHSRVK